VIGVPKGDGPSGIAFFSFGEGWTSEEDAAAWVKEHAESAAAQIDNGIKVAEEMLVLSRDDSGEFEFDNHKATASRNPDGSYRINGLRIAQVGLHTDRNGRKWDATVRCLDEIRDHHPELAGRGWRVPMVWSHDLDPRENQSPLAHIALGWMLAPYRNGEWLLADVDKIPPGIFKMIKAGAWASISPRVLRGIRIGDYTAPWAIGHLSLCGARKAAMKGLRTFDDIAGIYAGMTQHDEEQRTAEPSVSFAGQLAFDDAEPDKSTDGPGGSQASTRGGAMIERQEALAALGLTEEQLTAMTDAPGKERDAAKTELDTAQKAQEKLDLEARGTAAVDFAESHMKKVTVPDRQRIRAIHEALAAFEGDLEFSEEADGKTTTVTVNPLEAFCELTGAILKDAKDVVDLGEHGKLRTEHPGDGGKGKTEDKPPKIEADDVVTQDDGTIVEGTELAEAADKRAKEKIAEALKAGEVLEYADAYEEALEEITIEADAADE
jgi:hypothetical protein